MKNSTKTTTKTGTITKVFAVQGYGWIREDGEAGGDFFFHRSGLDRAIRFEDVKEGDRVEFVEGANEKGPRAEDVRVVAV